MPPLPQAPEVLQWVFRSYVLFAKRALTPQQDLDCLQQATADQAFTNAKAAGNVTGMTYALIYRAIERNTAAVGQASVICNETATNPEIAAITQHQVRHCSPPYHAC